MVSDEIMELLLEEQEVPLDLIHKTIREGTIAQQICPVLVGSAYKNKGVQPLLDAVNALPAQPARPRDLRQGQQQRDGRGPAGRRPRRARSSPWRSSSSRSRSARSPTCGSTRGRSRRATFYFNTPPAEEGADQPDPPRARRPEGRHRRGRRRRHRRRHGHRVRHRRHVLRRGHERLAREHLRRRAGHRPVDHAGQAGRLRQALQGPEPVHARGPDLPRPRRPGDERDDHLGHGRAAPGDLRRADPPRVQGRLHRRRPEGQLPRGADQGDAVQLQAQEADRRLGPVRPRRRRAGPARPAEAPEPFVFENKVTGGRIPSEYIPSVEKGFRDSLHKGPSPATRSSASRWSSRTARTTTSTRRTWPSRSAPATASARPSARPTRSCSSRS